MNLNIGSGYKRIDGYKNIDNNPDCNPDFLFDMREAWPIETGSVKSILAHHILEHFGPEFFHIMKEMYRVCENGATIDVLVPFPRHDIFLIDPTHCRPIMADTLAMFSQKRNKADIEAGGRETPIGIINNVDFEVINVGYAVDPRFQEAFQHLSNDECQHIVNTQFNVVLETHVIMMVVKDV